MQAGAGLLNLLQLFAMIVVYPAIMRAVIRPDERSWFSLRISMDEVRVAVVAAVVFGGLYVVLMIMMMLGFMVIAFMAALGASEVAAGAAMGVLMLTLLVAVLCAVAPFSLMAPASLHYRRFAFTEGWRLAKGRWGRLIGLQFTILAITIAVQILVGILLLLAVQAAMNTGIDRAWLMTGPVENPFPDFRALLATWWPLIVAASLFVCAFYGVLMTISTAPVASACAQLARRNEINSVTG